MYKLVLLRGGKKKKNSILEFYMYKIRKTNINMDQTNIRTWFCSKKRKKEIMINKELETTTINPGCTSSWKYFQHMVCENLNAE